MENKANRPVFNALTKRDAEHPINKAPACADDELAAQGRDLTKVRLPIAREGWPFILPVLWLAILGLAPGGRMGLFGAHRLYGVLLQRPRTCESVSQDCCSRLPMLQLSR